MWDYCGMSKNAEGLTKAKGLVKNLREEFWKDVYVPGNADEMNPELEKAARLADFIELGELMIRDALDREESCGAHFRTEYQTEDGEALRRDEEYSYVSAWQFQGIDNEPVLNKEPLQYEYIKLAVRSYK